MPNSAVEDRMRSSGHCLTAIPASTFFGDATFGDATFGDATATRRGPICSASTAQDRSRRRRPRLSRPLSPASRDKRSVRWAMFAKLKFVSARQATASCVALAYCNRDTLIARAGGRLSQSRRRNLVCRWRTMIGGGYECLWDIKPADRVATDGPHQRWMSIRGHLVPTLSRIRRRAGRGPANRRAAQCTSRWMTSET
jgi:hypothetical protein